MITFLREIPSPGALFLAFLLFLSPSLSAQISARDAQKQLKSATKVELAGFKNQIKAKAASLASDLDALLIAIEGGQVTLGIDAADSLEQILGNHVLSLFDCGENAQRSLEAVASGTLVQFGSSAAKGFLLGDGGDLDRFVANLEKETQKAQSKLLKTTRKIVKDILKLSEKQAQVSIYIPRLGLAPPPRPSAVAAPVPPQKILRIHTLLGWSDIGVQDDGIVCLGGVAQPGLGNVTVRLTDPAGSSSLKVVTVDLPSCRWRACFEDLTEGNYTVTATQDGGQADNSGIGVP